MEFKTPNLTPKQKEEIKHIMENLKAGDEIKICKNVFKTTHTSKHLVWTWDKGQYKTMSPEVNILHNKQLTLKRKDVQDCSISVKCETMGELNISWAILDYDFLYKHYGHYLKTKKPNIHKKAKTTTIKNILRFLTPNK